MDLNLLGLGIGLIVVGFAVTAVGGWLKERDGTAVRTADSTIVDLIMMVLREMITALGKIASGPSRGDRVQGLGSALVWIGAAVVLVSFLGVLGGSDSGADATAAPTPS